MKELVKIEKMDNGIQAVSAKELYRFLTDGDIKNYSRWLKMNITNNAFLVENVDYVLSSCVTTTSNGGQVGKDYALTVDLAYKLSMLSRTKRGDEARDYFLACKKELEKLLNQQQPKILTAEEILLQQTQLLVEHKKQLAKIESRQVEQDEQLKQVNQSVNNISNIVATNERNWRHDCDRILQKCANELDNEISYATRISAIRTEVYTRMKQDYSIDLNTRLKNAQKKMERLGVPQTKIKKLNKVDMIARDKKAIMAYVDVCKKMALKYKIVL